LYYFILRFNFYLIYSIESLHPQPSQERDDIRSPEQDTEPSEEIFSSAMPDLDSIYEAKPTEPLSLVYKESLCVPYTDEQDGKIKSY